MFHECLIWRRDFRERGVFGIDISEIYDQLKSPHPKTILCGVDKGNHPLMYILVRRHDRNISIKKTEMYCVYSFELVRETRLIFPNEKSTLIFDLTDFSLKNMDYTFLKYSLQTIVFCDPDLRKKKKYQIPF